MIRSTKFCVVYISLMAALIVSSFSGCQSTHEMSDLFVIRQDGKWGYMNRKGQVVIQPQFAWASWIFSEGLAEACLENKNKCGYIDKTGKFIISPQFQEAFRFSEGLAAVKVGDKIGYVDKDGKIVISPQFDDASLFSEGLAAISMGKKLGFVDSSGKIKIAPQFEQVSPFFDGLAAVGVGKKFGFIDKDGKFVIDPQFDGAAPFVNGLAAVQVGEKFGYIDKTGKIIISPQFDEALPFSYEGLALVVLNKKVGFINASGSYEIRPEFEVEGLPWEYVFVFATSDIGRVSFSEGLSPVKINGGKTGYIDKSGKFVIEPQFDSAYPFYNGIAHVISAENGIAWIDKQGRYVWREAIEKTTPAPTTNANTYK